MKKTIIFQLALLFCLSVNAQFKQLNDKLYNTRVKLVDEFFDRFNGLEGREDISTKDEQYREKNLLLLFNGQMFKSMDDPKMKNAKKMIRTIIDNNISINYSDSTWFAKATCHGKLKGKDVEFVLWLNVEKRKADMFKWVITQAEGKIFELTPSLKSEKIMLMPDDHETNFMSLSRITTEKDDYIINYARKSFNVDPTSVFFSYVYTGLLNIEYVSDLEFTFYQIPGYQFSIKQFDRETLNSGWLIDKFEEISVNQAQVKLTNLYK